MKKIAVLTYDNFTALDAVGPYEVLSRLPGYQLCFVAKEKGVKRSDTGMLGISADYTIDEVPDPAILLIPGGPGGNSVMEDEAILDWIRKAHETTEYTTSVCNGALILGAAGLLKGLDATTHWGVADRLPEFGATYTEQRVVEQGKIITAAGVSSGIDMALTLAAKIAGDDLAQGLQLGIEYDPQPPFDSGSPSKAPAHIYAMTKAMFDASMKEAKEVAGS